jgi:short subunit dehydrogenase-like uncharacterized protein
LVAEDKIMASDPIQPGEGPTKEEREIGFYDVLFSGSNDNGDNLMASVKGDSSTPYALNAHVWNCTGERASFESCECLFCGDF